MFIRGHEPVAERSRLLLHDTVPPPRVIDNLFRFLCGIYFGLGFLTIWVIVSLHGHKDLIYFMGIVVIFSGLGRLY
jgi:hypothetical protein